MYATVPATPCVFWSREHYVIVAMPTSLDKISLRQPKSIFSGLMSRWISFSSRANCFDSSQCVETNMLTKINLDKAAFSWEAYEAIVAKLLPGPIRHTQKPLLETTEEKA
jgi:hypothetical protein